MRTATIDTRRIVVSRLARAVALATAVTMVAACRRNETSVIPGASIDRGQQSLAGFGCGSCHVIDGVTGAHGKIGPPLTGIAERAIIAGQLANTPENMVRWIRDPQAVEANTAMPNLQVSEQSARDMVAYLYTLK